MGSKLATVEETMQQIVQGRDIGWSRMLCIIHQALQAREDDRENAYHERDQLIAVLSKLYPSHLAMHPAEDTEWEPDWRHIVCVHIDQPEAFLTLTWHVHDSELSLFSHLEMRDNDWDHSTTEEKYRRLRNLGSRHPCRQEGNPCQ